MATTDFKIRIIFEKVNDTEVDKLSSKIENLKTRYDDLKKKMEGVSGGSTNLIHSSANVSVALQSLNYTIRDSVYFFKDFQLGILAVGNNINPLFDSMLRLKLEANSLNTSLSSMLLKTLTGSQGIILAFTMLASVLQAVIFAMRDSNVGSDEFKAKLEDLIPKIREMRLNFEGLVEAQKQFEQQEERQARKKEFESRLEELRQKIKYPYERQADEKALLRKLTPEEINKLKDDLKNLEDEYNKFIGTIQVDIEKFNIERINEYLSLVAKGVSDPVKTLIETQKLSREGLRGLYTQLKDINDMLFVPTTGERRDNLLSEPWKKMVQQIKAGNTEFEKGIELLDKFLNPQKESKAKELPDYISLSAQSVNKDLEDAWQDYEKEFNKYILSRTEELANAERDLLQNLQKLHLATIKDTAEKQLIQTLYAIDELITETQNKINTLPPRLRPRLRPTIAPPEEYQPQTEEGKTQAYISEKEQQAKMIAYEDYYGKKQQENIDKLTKGIKDTSNELVYAAQLANYLGDALVDAFTRGKMSLGDFMKELGIFILKMAIQTAITKAFFLEKGGVVKAQGGYIVPGAIGFTDKVPALLSEGEMVLNYRQQQNLFKILNGYVPIANQDKYYKAMLNRLDALNYNISNLENKTIIYADADVMNFTRRKLNYELERLNKINVK